MLEKGFGPSNVTAGGTGGQSCLTMRDPFAETLASREQEYGRIGSKRLFFHGILIIGISSDRSLRIVDIVSPPLCIPSLNT